MYICFNPSFYIQSYDGYTDINTETKTKTETNTETIIKINLQEYFQPYKLEEVCLLYTSVFDSVVLSYHPQTGADARESANKEIEQHIPGKTRVCPMHKLPTKDASLKDIFTYVSERPDTYIVDIYATLLYCVNTLQTNLDTIKKKLSTLPPTPDIGKIFEGYTGVPQYFLGIEVEGFELKPETKVNVCSVEEATKKRMNQIPTCTLPEEVTPEVLQKSIQEKLELMKHKYEDYKKQGMNKNPFQTTNTNMFKVSYDELLQKGKNLLKELQALKKKLESGDISPPQ